MKRKAPKPPLTAHSLRNRFDRRNFIISVGGMGFGALLAGRLGYLAVAENAKYVTDSESNRVNLSPIVPRRGIISDRRGIPLATNKLAYRVDIIPDRLRDAPRVVAQLGEILTLSPTQVQDLHDKIDNAHGFQPVEVSANLTFDQMAQISVRLPDLLGVLPQQGNSRYYPLGPSVGHLIGYVGPANAEEYEKERDPLLITPGYKIGKDGLEKKFELSLRGIPGALRSEVTASGKVVKELGRRDDVQGRPLRLTIDSGLQDYAARRIGLESGSAVVMDCHTGEILCMASMPSFDPNSFADGIGRLEYALLRDDNHLPLRNKVLKGLYPPGSTVKPMVSLALMAQGIDPDETVYCGGGLRVGNRRFGCWNRRGHGQVNMAKAIYQSCDVYFYAMAQKIGMDPIAAMARRCGLGQEFPLPVTSQFYGTVPDPAWKAAKFDQKWQAFDTVNATIGQGYMLSSPLQMAVMAARIASGKEVMPQLLMKRNYPNYPSMSFSDTQLDYIHKAMSDVVNGPGTAGGARLPLDGVLMAGKTGTAQVVSLSVSNGKTGPWKYRDHGHFIFFAPADKPRYAGAICIEHGGGSGAAYPIARDIMTFLFDPQKAVEQLHTLEAGWGGTPQQRLNRKFNAATNAPVKAAPPRDEEIFKRVDNEARREAEKPATEAADAAENRSADTPETPVPVVTQ